MNTIGNISLGRPNLGQEVPVKVYRLFEVAVTEVLEERFGKEEADEIIREAGYKAGIAFSEENFTRGMELNAFLSLLQTKLVEFKIGILRIERVDLIKSDITLSVYEDLDCSGLPVTDESICVYDEGFISGILEYHFGKKFEVREVDCWATGERVCRFRAKAD